MNTRGAGKYLTTLEATGELTRPHQCPATNRRGTRCGRWAPAFSVCCYMHGSATARAKEARIGRAFLAQLHR